MLNCQKINCQQFDFYSEGITFEEKYSKLKQKTEQKGSLEQVRKLDLIDLQLGNYILYVGIERKSQEVYIHNIQN